MIRLEKGIYIFFSKENEESEAMYQYIKSSLEMKRFYPPNYNT